MSCLLTVTPEAVLACIQAFGGTSALARALGHKNPTTVDGWRKAGRFPAWRHAEIQGAADRLKIALPVRLVAEAA